jgi:nucleotide-binding universal stress UspA family protein
MPYKTILVHLNDEARAPALIAAAARLAQHSGAHVAGLFTMPPIFYPADVMMPMGPEVFAELSAEQDAQAARTKAIFEAACAGQPFVGEWRVRGAAHDSYEPIAEGLIKEARSAELLIVSQPNPANASPVMREVPVRAVMDSGRPVLVVPYAWTPGDDRQVFGKSIAVAWNDSRESARAVFTVREARPGRAAADVPAADIAATLARSGVRVDVEALPAVSGSAGSAILESAAARGCELLVMGLYGHSRLREVLLGGVSRDVLSAMTFPVLMSH